MFRGEHVFFCAIHSQQHIIVTITATAVMCVDTAAAYECIKPHVWSSDDIAVILDGRLSGPALTIYNLVLFPSVGGVLRRAMSTLDLKVEQTWHSMTEC